MAKAFKGFYSTLKTSNANAEQRLITFTYRVEKVIKMHRNRKKGGGKGGDKWRQPLSIDCEMKHPRVFFLSFTFLSPFFFQKKEFYIFLKTVVSKILHIVGAEEDSTSKKQKEREFLFFFFNFAIKFSLHIYRILLLFF